MFCMFWNALRLELRARLGRPLVAGTAIAGLLLTFIFVAAVTDRNMPPEAIPLRGALVPLLIALTWGVCAYRWLAAPPHPWLPHPKGRGSRLHPRRQQARARTVPAESGERGRVGWSAMGSKARRSTPLPNDNIASPLPELPSVDQSEGCTTGRRGAGGGVGHVAGN